MPIAKGSTNHCLNMLVFHRPPHIHMPAHTMSSIIMVNDIIIFIARATPVHIQCINTALCMTGNDVWRDFKELLGSR